MSNELSSISKRYSKVIFDIFYKKNHKTLDEIEKFINFIESSESLKKGLLSNFFSLYDKEKIIKVIIEKLNLTDEIEKILIFVNSQKRINIIIDIFNGMKLLEKKHKNQVEVNVLSAYQLNEDEKHKISDIFTKLFSKHPLLKCNIDSSLVSGFSLYFDNSVIDMSLKTYMNKLLHKN